MNKERCHFEQHWLVIAVSLEKSTDDSQITEEAGGTVAGTANQKSQIEI